ncbi:MAG: serine/threonine protein kinase [Mitsuaria chitosanitabida]|uniref:serine/threonine protein kinase n=1 Tax=Roseateles chitosanitabidus TaxID=65048 RepID=UPI001B01D845|nr:serine/threonine-protein kinase [Roseateles chitosanitabidus]MBO9688377.1 serine/threonine protein kinase [Roseateles chitosanitabidus]
MDALDKQRWIALSPLLDELLDLEEPRRSARLAEIRAADAAMGEHLEALLARDAALGQERFLEQPAAEALQGTPAPLSFAPEGPDFTGESIGPYVLDRELGQGGMGAVWLARRADGRFEGEVAVKFLKSGLFGKGDSGRFEREGQILARLSHPHIARLLDAGLHHGHQAYLVLEYVDGLPIDRYCQVNGLDVEARVKLFLDVLAAVAHAHQRLILHRDLKPSNILVTHDGQVKLLDFGIAKLLDDATQSGAATELTQRAGSAFTPQYAAPEQVQQGDVTTATDVYALGVLLYQLLGGRHPTADDTQQHLERLKAVVELVPKRLSDVAENQLDPVVARQSKLLRGDLDTIVGKALKKIPAERYANAESMAVDLRHWLAHEPITARPDTRLYVMGRFVRRHRWSVAAGSAAVMVLVGLTTVSVLQARRASMAEHQAQERRQQADDLLSYMLGEFADKLRPVGRLELLDSVGSKALTYLAQDDKASPQERLQRAKALTVIGEVRVTKRSLKEAIEPLMAAQRLLAGSVPTSIATGDWRKAQGAAAFWLGQAHYRQSAFEQATEAILAYRDAEQAWLDAEPDSQEALLELSYAYNSLGSLRLDTSDLRGASDYFKRSIDLKRKALEGSKAPDQATARMELADSLSWLGTSLLWQGMATAATANFAESVGLVSDVRKAAPLDDGWAYREAILRRWHAESLQKQGDHAAAVDESRRSLEQIKALIAKDPANTQWRVNGLHSEVIDSEIRWSDTPSSMRAAQLREIGVRIDDYVKKLSPAGVIRTNDVRFRWAALYAKALNDIGDTAGADRLLAETIPDPNQAAKGFPADLRQLASWTMARLAQMDLLRGTSAPNSIARREALCLDVIDKIEKKGGLLMVHQQITRAWVEAQSCLGRGNRDSVKAAEGWLASERAGQPS